MPIGEQIQVSYSYEDPVHGQGSGSFGFTPDVSDNAPPLKEQIRDTISKIIPAGIDITDVAFDRRADRQDAARSRFAQLTQGLDDITPEDRSYAVLGRIMAYKDGAGNAAILAIVDKATAQSYVTSKSRWTALSNASKAWEADVLETMAGVIQVALLVLE